jgi:hypothetical protein
VRARGQALGCAAPASADEVVGALGADVRRVVFDAQALTAWDSSLVTVLVQVLERSRGRRSTWTGPAPRGCPALLASRSGPGERGRAAAAHGRRSSPGWAPPPSRRWRSEEFLAFLGEATLSLGRLVSRRAPTGESTC